MFSSSFLLPLSVAADGGLVRARQQAGPFVVTVFTSPTPLRVGTADISVMVQQADANTPVLDAEVSVSLQPVPEGVTSITAAATRAQATNKLLYAALVELPTVGRFALAVNVQHGTQQGRVDVNLDVMPPQSPIRSFWPYFAVPPLAIVLFVVHQRLKRT